MAEPNPILLETSVYEFRARRVFENYDQEFTTVLNFVFAPGSPAGGSTFQTLFSALVEAWRTQVIPVTPNTVEAGQYELREFTGRVQKTIEPETFKLFGSTVDYLPMDVTGDPDPDQGALDVAALEMLPPYCSVGYVRRTGRPVRGGASVIRYGPIPESMQVDGLLNGAGLTLYATPLNLFGGAPIALVGDDEAIPVIFNKTAYLRLPAGAVAPSTNVQPIGTGFLSNYLGTQNTRKHPNSRIGY